MPVDASTLSLVRAHGLLHVDVDARDGLDLGGADVGLAVRLVLLATVAAARKAPAGRSRGTCVRGPTSRVDKEKKSVQVHVGCTLYIVHG